MVPGGLTIHSGGELLLGARDKEGQGGVRSPSPWVGGRRCTQVLSVLTGTVFATSHNPDPESFGRPFPITLKT